MREIWVIFSSLVKVQTRSVWMLMWLILLPVVMFFLFPGRILLKADNVDPARVVYEIVPFLIYTLFGTATANVGFFLVNWRDQGVLRAVVQNYGGLKRLVVGLLLANVLVSILNSLVFMAVCTYVWGTGFIPISFSTFALVPLLAFCLSCASFLLLRVRVTAASASQLVNFGMIVLLITASMGVGDFLRSGLAVGWDRANPIAISSRLLFFPLTGRLITSDLLVLVFVTLGGLISLRKTSLMSVEGR